METPTLDVNQEFQYVNINVSEGETFVCKKFAGVCVFYSMQINYMFTIYVLQLTKNWIL